MARCEPKIQATFKCGFEAISGLSFNPDVTSKGQKLIEDQAVDKGHLRNVREIIFTNDENTRILASCIPQTRLNENDYDLVFDISKNREVLRAHCSCPAGVSGSCKHGAALFQWINQERTEAKTDEPQKWLSHSQHLQNCYPKVNLSDVEKCTMLNLYLVFNSCFSVKKGVIFCKFSAKDNARNVWKR